MVSVLSRQGSLWGQGLLWACFFLAGTHFACGPEMPPRAQLAEPQPARALLFLRQDGGPALQSEPLSVPRPSSSDLRLACLGVLSQNPLMRQSKNTVLCLERDVRRGTEALVLSVPAPDGLDDAALLALVR
jgi:hypothetical protein